MGGLQSFSLSGGFRSGSEEGKKWGKVNFLAELVKERLDQPS
jgi:hypothetical protein